MTVSEQLTAGSNQQVSLHRPLKITNIKLDLRFLSLYQWHVGKIVLSPSTAYDSNEQILM